MSIAQDIQSLAPGSLVELFELDATALGGSLMRFHAGTNQLRNSVVWQGNTYQPFPIEASGFDFDGQGKLPRPIMRVANVTGLLGALVRQYSDLLGAKVTRKRTLAKYLDAANFPSRRNLLTYTESPSNAVWTKVNTTTGAAEVLSPFGTVAESLIETFSTVSGNKDLRRIINYTAGQPYTVSAMVRARDTSALRYAGFYFPVGIAFTSARSAVFDLATGEVTFATPGLLTASAERFGSWLRISATVTPEGTAGATTRVCLTRSPTNAVAGHAGDGVSGFDLTALQAEPTVAATEYQPVPGATWSANPTADPNEYLPDDVYFIDRKAAETKVYIEFELAAAFDVSGVKLPRRIIAQNVCPWRYRVNDESSACSWTGTTYYDANDQLVLTAGEDVCGKRLSSCQARFGTASLPFGGFPGAGLTR